MPEDPLLDPVWNALHTVHAHFALRNGSAVRYPADVVPYAAMANPDHADLSPLADLLAPSECVYLIGAQPQATKNLQVGPMGTYYGIRINHELVAMAGERLAVPGFREISAVVTRPGHTGRGYATRLMNRLLQDHAAEVLKSFLHVSERNSRAVAIYQRMGFAVLRSVALWPISLIP